MSYKYFYRIKYERKNADNEWVVGSITEQFRNSPLESRDFNNIRRHIYTEMDAFDVTEVRACIYRISSFSDYRISVFDGTENEVNHDYDRICGCYVPLVGIVHISNTLDFTQHAWLDCGVPCRSKFHANVITKEWQEV